jgi:ligand-binding sensor domain-containing protein/signal transduction histidine kinase
MLNGLADKARIMKRIYLVFSLLLSFTALFAKMPDNLRFGRISVEELSQSTTYYSYQDSQGFLWFGTEDGLNKYDGYSFVAYKYDSNDSSTISNNIIRCIFEDSKENLWIGTDNGLNLYNRANGSFKRYMSATSKPASISNNIISAITEDKQGNLWIGTGNGLNLFNSSEEKFTVYKSNSADAGTLTSNVISALYYDRNGKLWVGTNSNGLNIFDPVTKQNKRIVSDPRNSGSLSENEITCITSDAKGNIWIGTVNGGINVTIDGSGFSHYNTENGLASNSVFSIHQDKKGSVWIGTLGGGLNVLDLQDGKFSTYQREPQNNESISSNKVWHVFEDNAGTLWLATSSGISFYNRTIAKFTTYRLTDDTEQAGNNSIFAVWEDKDGNVWTGALGGGLNVFSRREQKFINDRFPSLNNPSLRFVNVFAICEDSKGTLWLGTSDALMSYNKNTGQIQSYRHDAGKEGSLSNNYVRCIYEDRNGVLWIGTHGGGLNAFDRLSGKFTVYRNNTSDINSLSNDVVMAIVEDKKGELWIATYGGGLNLLNRASGKFTVYRNDLSNTKSINNNFVHCIYENADGKLWVGTYGGGLNILDRATGLFEHYTERDGLSNNIINGIVADEHGSIWISTNDGVCKITSKKGESPLTANFRTYNKQDGLQSKFNENACFRGRGGWLYFGGSSGLNAFHPDSINDNTVQPPVVITRFLLFEKPTVMDTLITSKRTLDLEHTQNFFSFEFAALNYLFPEKNRYAYKLEGLDNEWIYSGSRRYAYYTNLDPGNYIFRVKACNNDGVWNETGISIYITITPPIYKTWWFTALCALFVTLIVFAYIRIRTNSLVKQNIVLEEKVNQRTHELQEKNVELIKTMDNLRSTQTQLIQSEKMASLGQLTAGIAHEIQNPLNFVNNFSELSVELLSELESAPAKEEQTEIIDDLKQNLQKITFHGKRADSIVKGMLQHSRSSTAEKQLTDINKLVEEFFSLAYHGMRAKDPGFNCTMEKHLAPDIPMIKIIPQDVSRVILNIFNNSFYAVDEKAKTVKDYQPTVSITTKLVDSKVQIIIRDNGKGITEEIKEKIFNPFFTTKPTGQGTGLGLSISYDIIVKGHGGGLQVDSKPGEFTEFMITLPV